MRTFVRYLLFQVPGWLLLALFLVFLVDKAALPSWATIGFFVVWVLKDFAIYPIVRRAYERNVATGSERLIGATGATQELLAPGGYIKVQGELWKARVEDHDRPIPKNTPVRVKGAQGMTLLVEAELKQEEPRVHSISVVSAPEFNPPTQQAGSKEPGARSKNRGQRSELRGQR